MRKGSENEGERSNISEGKPSEDIMLMTAGRISEVMLMTLGRMSEGTG